MYLTLAWRNIWRNKRRSLITILSIMFAVFFASLMRSLQVGSYERMIENAARFYTGYIQVHKNGYWDDKVIDNSFAYEESLLETINSVEGVDVAVPRIESFALAAYDNKTKGALVLGIDSEKENLLTRVNEKIVEGDMVMPGDRAVVIGEGLSSYLKLGIGDSIVLIGQGYHGVNAAGVYAIKGIVKFPIPSQNDQTVYMPLEEAQWFYGAPGLLTSISLVVDKAKNVDRIVADLNGLIDLDRYEVMGWESLMPELVQGIELDDFGGKIIIVVLYIVIGFSLFGTFLMLTAERMYEFGVMMSVGMRRAVMQWIVFLEMTIMSSIGVLAGVVVSFPFIYYMHLNPIEFDANSGAAMQSADFEAVLQVALEPGIFTSQAWAILIMVLILGFYPLLVIRRLKPVEAMRNS